MEKISKNAVIFPKVKLGKNCQIEDFCVIGKSAKDGGEKETVIGDNSIVRTGTVIYAGTKTGKNFQTGDGAKIGPDNVFGNNVTIGTNSVVLKRCQLADGVRIHTLVELAEWMKIGENTWIGPGVKTANMIHPKRYQCIDKDWCEKEGTPIIGKDVRIGTNATICPFVEIGDGAIIGAAANVTKSVPKGMVAIGNPAKVFKKSKDIICRFDKTIFPYRKK